jgi:hypothetical protein
MNIKACTAVALTVLFAAHASASCPSISHQSSGPFDWYVFDVDSSCATVNYATPATLWSCGLSAYEFGTGYQDVTWSYTIPADGTTINNGTYNHYPNWSATVFIDFYSPQQTIYDSIYATLTVTHNGSDTTYSIASLQGNSASSQTCGRFDVGFSAVNGDTITLKYTTSKWGTGSTIRGSLPQVFNYR